MRMTLSMTVVSVLALVAGTAAAQPAPGGPPPPAPRPAPVCATPEQVKQVGEFYTKTPGMMPALATRMLKMPESAIASALPKDQATIVSGAEFVKLWETATAWPTAAGLILRDGNVFELPGKVMPGEPSKSSNFYNLKSGGGVQGHLRPDMMSAVAVFALPGKEDSVTRGMFFYNGAGESIFGIAVVGEAGEGSKPSDAGVAAFDKTMSLAKSLPRVCG